jgi:hypothetical protein
MTTSRVGAVIIFAETHKCLPYVRAVQRQGLSPLLIGLHGHTTLAGRAISTAAERRTPLEDLGEFSVRAGDEVSEICGDVLSWSRRYDIRAGVIASESLVEGASLAMTLLGVPSIGMKAGRVCRDKSLQRLVFHDLSPRWRLVRGRRRSDRDQDDHAQLTRDAAEIVADLGEFPIVVKPTSLESSQGVRTLSSLDEVADTLRGMGREDALLFEERIYGPEYTVDAIVAGGRVAAIFMSEKRTNENAGPHFVELAHTVPPRFDDPGRRLLLETTGIHVINRLGIQTGMVHGEFRVTDDNRVVLMEIAARPPGDATVPMYSISTGRSVEDMLVDACLGREVSLSSQYVRQVRQTYLTGDGPGRLVDIQVNEDLTGPVMWLADGSGVWPDLSAPTMTGEMTRGIVELKAAPVPGGAVRGVLVLKPRNAELGSLVESGSRPVTVVFDVPVGGDIDALEDRVLTEVRVHIDDSTVFC